MEESLYQLHLGQDVLHRHQENLRTSEITNLSYAIF